jgi:hypothetical protein
MKAYSRLAVVPVLLLVAACGREEAPLASDAQFLAELELAIAPPTEAPVISPAELGMESMLTSPDLSEAPASPAQAANPAPARPAPSRSAAPARSSASSGRSASGSTASASAPAPRVETVSNARRDAVIGAGAGAVLGATVAGSNNRVRGAVIGAAVGGATGAVVGSTINKSTRVVYDFTPL